MKGQYLTIEYVLFFAIGIAMVVAVYFAFSGINSTVRTSTMQAQLDRTGEMIRGNIVSSFEVSRTTGSMIVNEVRIPTSLSGCVYQINVIGNNLDLNCTQDMRIGSVISLYNINTTAENIIYSTEGKIVITNSLGKVVLK